MTFMKAEPKPNSKTSLVFSKSCKSCKSWCQARKNLVYFFHGL